MGKPEKRSKLHQKDVFQRLNFLYQAAHIALTGSSADWDLSRHYTTTLRTLAQKNVLRLHPNLKRTLCKSCDMLLIPGISSKVRLKEGKMEILIVECLNCNTIKRFPCQKDFSLWHDKPENIDQIIVLEPSRPLVSSKGNTASDSGTKTQKVS